MKNLITNESYPTVENLRELVTREPEVGGELIISFSRAHGLYPQVFDFLDKTTREGKLGVIYNYLEMCERNIPVEADDYTYRNDVGFYFLTGYSPMLANHDEFQDWSARWVEGWGNYLSLHDSVKYIEGFIKHFGIDMSEYVVEEWKTFNHFFARKMKTGKRPIAEGDNVVVFPADSTFAQLCPIDGNNNIDPEKMVKSNNVYSINKLLTYINDGKPVVSEYADCFKGGVFFHSYLAATDYHRYHLPVAGTIREVQSVKERNYYNVFFDKHDTLKPFTLKDSDSTGYQFTQTRSWVIVETAKFGYVAVIPVGMGQVASANINVRVGESKKKGAEFGYFLFGGSDVICLFEKKARFVLDRHLANDVTSRKLLKMDLYKAVDDRNVTIIWKKLGDMKNVIHRQQGQVLGKFE